MLCLDCIRGSYQIMLFAWPLFLRVASLQLFQCYSLLICVKEVHILISGCRLGLSRVHRLSDKCWGLQPTKIFPDSKVHGTNMRPIWGWHDSMDPINFATWVMIYDWLSSLELGKQWNACIRYGFLFKSFGLLFKSISFLVLDIHTLVLDKKWYCI